jgi:DNA-binding LacI/PurR family transcriptional regulator
VTTLREVAKLAGVSTATVSRVISDTAFVSPDTRARVLQVIEEIGYRPNLAARALSKGRTFNVGVVFQYNFDPVFYDPFMLTIVQGIEAVCTAHGYNLLLSTPRIPVVESEQFLRLMSSGYLDGAITTETIPGEFVSTIVTKSGYPCIGIVAANRPPPPNSVMVDEYPGAYAIMEYLLKLGHRRIGIIELDPANLTSAPRRMVGYRTALEAAGLDFDAVPIVTGAFTIQSGYEAAGQLLCKATPSAIVCMNDRMAMGVIQRLHADGLRVPEDITVVGFDDIPGAEYFNPPLTTVRQHAHLLGATAAKMLFDLIDNRDSRGELDPIVLQPELVIRASAAPPKVS